MEYHQFADWISRLSPADRDYLDRQRGWAKEYQRIQREQALTKGFLEKTMELLEGGSESET